MSPTLNTSAATLVPPQQAPADPCAITASDLLAASPQLRPDMASVHAAALEAVRAEAELTTPVRVRHFLAQCAHESAGFTRLAESLAYRDPVRLDETFRAVRDVHHARALIAGGPQAIANCVYAGRYGNGDARSFDGWNYRGRGYLQLTFRDNYVEAGRALGLPLDAQPELVAQPPVAAKVAAWFWRSHRINLAADHDDVAGVTGRINPALDGLDSRKAWVERFRRFYP